VGAGVVEVFPFQPNARATLGSAVVLAEALRLIQRRWPPHVGAKKVIETLGEGGISPSLCSGSLQLGQGRHEGFRHVLAAEGAKTPERIGSNLRGQEPGIGSTGGVWGRESAGHVAARKQVVSP
jgi:hypothetical protein